MENISESEQNIMQNRMQKQFIIAICGLKRSGKDTVANYLATKIPNVIHCKIAQPLKDMCENLFNFTASQMETDDKDVIDTKWGITPRDALKFVGTEMMQYKIQELLPDIGRSFWVKQLVDKIKKNQSNEENKTVIISDLRFIHEYDMIKREFKDSQVVIVKIQKNEKLQPNQPNKTNHCSELEWQLIKHNILLDNNGTIQDLYKQIDAANIDAMN